MKWSYWNREKIILKNKNNLKSKIWIRPRSFQTIVIELTRSRHICVSQRLVSWARCHIIIHYMYKLITNYLFINCCWLPIICSSIVVDYQLFVHQLLLITHICVLYVYKWMCNILRKRKACCKKTIVKVFFNLTVITNVL